MATAKKKEPISFSLNDDQFKELLGRLDAHRIKHRHEYLLALMRFEAEHNLVIKWDPAKGGIYFDFPPLHRAAEDQAPYNTEAARVTQTSRAAAKIHEQKASERPSPGPQK